MRDEFAHDCWAGLSRDKGGALRSDLSTLKNREAQVGDLGFAIRAA